MCYSDVLASMDTSVQALHLTEQCAFKQEEKVQPSDFRPGFC